MDVRVSGNDTSSLCVASAAMPDVKADCEMTFIFLLATHSNSPPFRAECNLTAHLGEHTRIMDHSHLTPCFKAKYELVVRSDVPNSMVGLCNLGTELITVAKRASANAIRVIMFKPLEEEWCDEHMRFMESQVQVWGAIDNVQVLLLGRTHNHVVNCVENASAACSAKTTQSKNHVHMRLSVPQSMPYRTVCTVNVRDSSYSTSCGEVVIVPEPLCRGCVAIVLYFENTPVQQLRDVFGALQELDAAATCMHTIMSTITQMDANKITQAFTRSLSSAMLLAPDLTRMASCDRDSTHLSRARWHL